MHSKPLFRIIILIFLFCPTFAFASDDKLDLTQAIQMAYDQNPQMIQAREAVVGKQGALLTTRTFANPEVEVEIGGLKENEEGQRKGHLDSIIFSR